MSKKWLCISIVCPQKCVPSDLSEKRESVVVCVTKKRLCLLNTPAGGFECYIKKANAPIVCFWKQSPNKTATTVKIVEEVLLRKRFVGIIYRPKMVLRVSVSPPRKFNDLKGRLGICARISAHKRRLIYCGKISPTLQGERIFAIIGCPPWKTPCAQNWGVKGHVLTHVQNVNV